MKKTILGILLIICSLPFVYAGSFEFKGSTDKMSMNEDMGDVLEAITSSQLTEVKSGSTSTKEGQTKYTQYLRFKDVTTALNSSSVQSTKNQDTSEVNDFLVVNKGTAVTDAFFEWHISFDEGLKSKVDGEKLDGLKDATISILADDYSILDASVSSRKLKLILGKGAISDVVKQQEKKVYTIGAKSYEVEVSSIETSSKKVKFKVAGKETSQLGKGEIESIDAGVFIGVADVLQNSNDPHGSSVKLFIGANVLEFVDDNYGDDSFTNDVNVNKQKITNGFVKISAALIGDILKISSIKYRLVNPETIYAKAGDGIKQLLKQPDGLLGNWDMHLVGFENVATTNIKITPVGGNDEYKLDFVSPEDKTISIPLVINKGSFKLGDATKDLIIAEGTGNTNFNIDKDDSFILTSANAKSGKTYVLTYEALNNESNTISFVEIGGSQKTVTFEAPSDPLMLGQGTLSIGAISAKFYIELAPPNRLAIDLNGDGDVASDSVNIITKGGGILNLGATNTPTAPYTVTLTTDGSQFEETTSSETLTFTIQTSQSTPLGISETISGLATAKSKESHVIGVSNYGVRVDLLSSSDSADTLSIIYPLSQVFVKLLVETGSGGQIQTKIQESKDTQCTNKKQDGDETGVDCGGSCNACPTCGDHTQNQGELGVDCGGPCLKACTVEEKKVTETCEGCWQSLEKGKKTCLQFGTKVGSLYCSKTTLLVPMKKNGEVCAEAYECKNGHCENGVCGRTLTPSILIINGAIILLILLILYYLFTLLK